MALTFYFVFVRFSHRPMSQSRLMGSSSSEEKRSGRGVEPRVRRLMSQFHRRSNDSEEQTAFFGPLERCG
jgi:hypothetical protein